MEQHTITLEEQIDQRLREEANKKGVSLSMIITDALKKRYEISEERINKKEVIKKIRWLLIQNKISPDLINNTIDDDDEQYSTTIKNFLHNYKAIVTVKLMKRERVSAFTIHSKAKQNRNFINKVYKKLNDDKFTLLTLSTRNQIEIRKSIREKINIEEIVNDLLKIINVSLNIDNEM